jgi:hypothetical protein
MVADGGIQVRHAAPVRQGSTPAVHGVGVPVGRIAEGDVAEAEEVVSTFEEPIRAPARIARGAGERAPDLFDQRVASRCRERPPRYARLEVAREGTVGRHRVTSPRRVDGGGDERSGRGIEDVDDRRSIEPRRSDSEPQAADHVARFAGESESEFLAIHCSQAGHRAQGGHAVVAAAKTRWCASPW